MTIKRITCLIAGSALAAFALLIPAWMSFLNTAPKTGPEEALIIDRSAEIVFPVRTAIARKQILVKRLSASGTLRARREVEIRSRVAGCLTGVSAYNGKYVNRGEPLATIDDRAYRVAFDRARANLLNAQIEFRTLSATPFLVASDSLETQRRRETEMLRIDTLRQMYNSGHLDDEAYARLYREREAALAYLTANRGDVIAGRSGLAQSREAFETANLNLEGTRVAAPFPGHVADCLLVPGMHVGEGQLLLKLLDLSALLVDVDILESEVGRIVVGQKARIQVVGFPGRQFYGSVLHLNPLVDAKSRTMRATIVLESRRRERPPPLVFLRPGMFATVFVETDVLHDRLVVPRVAVLERDERSLVFTLEGSLAKWHYVETGERNEELVEILDGLGAGDTVMIDGHHTLAHDARVSITNRMP